MERIRGLDHGTYYFFDHLFNRTSPWPALFKAARFVGDYWFAACIALAAAYVVFRKVGRREAFILIGFFLAGVLISEGLSFATHRSRPADAQNIVGADDLRSSFPARSVFLATYGWLVLATALQRLSPRKSIALVCHAGAVLMLVFTCLVQLVLSLHFLTDILAALAGGGALALFANYLVERANIPVAKG